MMTSLSGKAKRSGADKLPEPLHENVSSIIKQKIEDRIHRDKKFHWPAMSNLKR